MVHPARCLVPRAAFVDRRDVVRRNIRAVRNACVGHRGLAVRIDLARIDRTLGAPSEIRSEFFQDAHSVIDLPNVVFLGVNVGTLVHLPDVLVETHPRGVNELAGPGEEGL